jgi:hypothetical protein
MLFAKRCKFLMIVSLINIENVSSLLWYILHEKSSFCFIDSSNFFNIDILLNKLLADIFQLIDMDTINYSLKQFLKNGINNLIYICIIFFICQYLLLNEIKQIIIKIITDKFNNDNIQIFFNEEMIIEFQINFDSKEINIINMIPNIDRRYIEGLNYIKQYFTIIIPNQVQNKINMYKQTTKLIKNIFNKINKQSIKNYLNQLPQSQPKL